MAASVGEKYGRLTVMSLVAAQIGKRSRLTAICRCDCGAAATVLVYTLGKSTNSCGCLNRENAAVMNRSHGLSGTAEYIAWKAMLQRCYYVKGKSYKNYGGRGIAVCRAWRNSFATFLEDVGRKPTPGHTLERIDNNKDYQPENVRWATRLEQGSNTRKSRHIEFDGRTQTLSQWSRELNIPITTLWHQLNRGGVPSQRV